MIPNNRAASLAALALLVACQLYGSLASASSLVRILDESDPLDIAAIARAMCKPSTVSRARQISRLSTVDRLVEFFDQQVSSESHALFKCKQKHGEALHQLQEALNASKENVCSAKKMALLEDFHNQFVSRLVEHKKSRREEHREAAPHLLRLFFMHYAMEVDAVCTRSLVKNVESDLKQKLGADIDEKLFELKDQTRDLEERAPLSAVFKKAMQKFSDINPAEKCEDVLMVWDLIENSRAGEKLVKDEVTIEDELDPQTGEPIRMLVKLMSSRSLNAIKDHCHYNLKPIYSKLVLPIIKLADLGYSNNNGRQLKSQLEQMKTSEEVKRWISATQMCEALLPIKFYEDSSLSPKDVVIITRREAAEHAAPGAQSAIKSEAQLVYEPETNSMEGLDRIESVAQVEPKKLVKSVKSNVRARRHIIGRIVIRLVRKLKSSSVRSRASRIFFSKPAQPSRLAHSKSGAMRGQFVKEEIGQQFSKSLDRMSDEDIEKLEGGAPSRMLRSGGNANGLVRTRRYGLTRLFDVIAFSCHELRMWVFMTWALIMVLVVVIIVLVPALAG